MRFLVTLAKCPLSRAPDREQEALAGRAQRIRVGGEFLVGHDNQKVASLAG